MKRKTKPSDEMLDDLRPGYDFDFSKSRPNRFAPLLKDTIAVVLEPDVARVFNTSESVNELLRSVIAAMPNQTRRAEKRKKAS